MANAHKPLLKFHASNENPYTCDIRKCRNPTESPAPTKSQSTPGNALGPDQRRNSKMYTSVKTALRLTLINHFSNKIDERRYQ